MQRSKCYGHGIIIAVAAIAAMMLSGCQTLQTQPATAKLTIQYAVLKFAEQSGGDVRASRLANVKKIAIDVKALASGSSTNVGFLHDAVNDQLLKLKLSPADRLLANGLVDIVTNELLQRIGTGALSPDQVLAVSQVMDWIIEATGLA